MFDATPPEPVMQRSQGRAFVAMAARRGQVRLVDLAQSGSAKAMFPRVAGAVPEVVFLNTSGGLTGGDRLAYQLEIGAGARVCATTQTAERAYASGGGVAEVRVQAQVGAAARLDWLPQETLIYEGANLSRLTEIDLAAGASCLLAETLVLGRQAMGEKPRAAHLRDERRVRREGRLVWAETLLLSPEVLQAQAAALLGEARAFAVVALIGPGAADLLGCVRAVLTHAGCEAAASAWEDKCVVRIFARDGWPLRQQLAAVLSVLSGRALPRVWQAQGLNGE